MIKILDLEIDKDNFPKLYEMAKDNPEGLERTLISLAKASGGETDSYHQDAVNLEMDLQHG